MRSFKYKLVTYCVLLALLPVAGALYGFESLAKRHEVRRIDGRLRADLRSATGGYPSQLDAAERRTQVVPISGAVHRLVARIDPRDTLLAARDGTIVTGNHRGQTLALVPGVPALVVVDGHRYRGLAGKPVRAGGDVQFAVLVSQRELDDAIAAAQWRIAAVLLGALALLGLVVYLLGVSIVRTLGPDDQRFAAAADEVARGRFRGRLQVTGRDEFSQVGEAFNRMAAQLEQRIVELEQERRRTREVTVRFGKALTATHDVDLLLRVVVETMVDATAAEGGIVIGGGVELARAGDPDRGVQRLELPLTVGGEAFGTVTLCGASFDEEQVETASSIAAQAAVALDNARLHRIVEQQALVDSLTGLSNRRALELILAEEAARAERFGGDVCLVFIDLDRFKTINDRFGHVTGDHALRVFAQTLREAVRDIDASGRWGGEEFALILPGTDATGGVALAERVRAALLERPIDAANGELVQMTASFGVAALSASRTIAALVADADDALYKSKRQGRDRVVSAIDTVRR
jgi:diguanylate cyclase (GGDEF)-like protein